MGMHLYVISQYVPVQEIKNRWNISHLHQLSEGVNKSTRLCRNINE